MPLRRGRQTPVKQISHSSMLVIGEVGIVRYVKNLMIQGYDMILLGGNDLKGQQKLDKKVTTLP